MVEADSHLKLLPDPFKIYTKYLSTLICCPWAYISSLAQLYPPYLAQIFGYLVTCGVKIMSLCHGWGWQPPQTASRVYIRNIQSIWAHWYSVHGHTLAALHSYTHLVFGSDFGFGVVGSHVELKWCHYYYVMVEAGSHIKLLFTSKWDITKFWPHRYAVHRHTVAALCSNTHSTWLRFWGTW